MASKLLDAGKSSTQFLCRSLWSADSGAHGRTALEGTACLSLLVKVVKDLRLSSTTATGPIALPYSVLLKRWMTWPVRN